MTTQRLFIERRPQGDYAVRKANSERASVIADTQKEAIERAKQLDNEAFILVERIRKTKNGHPDKWRKP
jgi:hypothetical protein